MELHVNPADSHMVAVSKAVRMIMDKIVTNQYPGGQMLTETRLSDDCQTSRGTVRAALQILEGQGLIETLPNGRRQVVGFSEQFINDLYDMRILFERLALEILLQQDKDRFQCLGSLLNLIEQQNSQEGVSTDAHIQLDFAFHTTLIESSRNKILLQCWQTIAPVMWTLLRINATIAAHEWHLTNYAKHADLAELLAIRSPELLSQLSDHLNESRRMVLVTLKDLKYIS